MSQRTATYPNGHHDSVLRSHTWRTAQNSAGYLLSSILPHMNILDIGCGPGTITADFAALVPDGHVVGLENASVVLKVARETAERRGVKNVQFVVGDVHALDYPDDTFDIVHAHQVLQHVSDPVRALQEMRRVTKPGGIVAVREADGSTMTWYPEFKALSDGKELWHRVARANGGEPDAGRRLRAWARQAGFDPARVVSTASNWCYYTPQEREWWSNLWADRVVLSKFAQVALDGEYATKEDLARIAQAWRDWGVHEDGWFTLSHGEILCHV